MVYRIENLFNANVTYEYSDPKNRVKEILSFKKQTQ